MTDTRLKSFAERINRLLDEKQTLSTDIGEIYQEVKSAGYVPKILRKAITRQRMEPEKRAEEDSILELYEAGLDGPTRKAVEMAAQGATSREIEAATGIDHVTASRAVSLKKNPETENRRSVAVPASSGAVEDESKGLVQPPAAATDDDTRIPDFLRRTTEKSPCP